ncbi:embryo defective protein [Artemisia annua]|uniref:Embryo defective protein n=1 Tax=Artemisia annua TaxID=35608 RepID=A0A2U1PIH3_ARTAN|nr:embryo defective protein [Artemisia annua]
MSNLSGYPPPMMQQIIYNRPTIPYNFYANSPNPNQGENQSNLSQSFPIGLQPIAQLQPLQPPQRPPQPPPPHLRPPGPALTPSDHAMSGPVHMQVQQLQMIQPSLASPAHVYYQTMQQDHFPHAQHQQQQQRLDPQLQVPQQGQSSNSLQQDASSLSLQDMISSPAGIQSLLEDREKLVQLLEQNPKLMDMLQSLLEDREKLVQLLEQNPKLMDMLQEIII